MEKASDLAIISSILCLGCIEKKLRLRLTFPQVDREKFSKINKPYSNNLRNSFECKQEESGPTYEWLLKGQQAGHG